MTEKAAFAFASAAAAGSSVNHVKELSSFLTAFTSASTVYVASRPCCLQKDVASDEMRRIPPGLD